MPNKQPQDRKPKAAVQRLRDEAEDRPLDTLLGKSITIDGRLGSVDVTVLEDPLEWDAKADEYLTSWAKAGGIPRGEMLPFLRCIISVEDGVALDRIRPSRKAEDELIETLTGNDVSDELGESSAS